MLCIDCATQIETTAGFEDKIYTLESVHKMKLLQLS